VSDPEIPAVSVVDLGIVRELIWQEDETCEVIITPTYSGCPATQVITESIEQALQSLGVEKITIRTQLSPAWTTDWMDCCWQRKTQSFWYSATSALRITRTIID
jgi:ring-1,2-phenylacetyl-CoA epoxidase subunit PaaD